VSERDPYDDAREYLDRPAPGRHRAEPSRSSLSRVLAPLAAVAVVAAAIVVLVIVRGHSSGSGPGAGVITAPTHRPITTPHASPTSTPSVALTHPAPTHPAPRHTRPPASRTAMAPVRVYNSTRITGLAHHVAAEVASRGWTVPDVGNVTNAIPTTTLYYSPSAHAAAQHLASEFSGIHRIEANSALGIHYSGLTIVLTADWHD
jgi:hypothetical protein